MGNPTGILDLEKHFAYHGAYHSNPVNILLHTLFAWPILFNFLVLFRFIPPVFEFLPSGLFSDALVFNFGFMFALFHALLYLCLDKKAGSLAALLVFACWVGASFTAITLGFSLAWKVVVAAQLFCVGGAAMGHHIFEKRAPRDTFFRTLVMEPFFVFLQVLQTVFGYEPYPGFRASVEAKREVAIKAWKDKNQKKVS